MLGKLVLTVVCGALIGICAVAFAQVELVWTIANARSFLPVPQSAPFERAMVATGINMFVISAAAAGLMFGYFKQTFKGAQWWRLVPIAPAVLLIALCQFDWLMSVPVVCFYLSMFLGERVYIELAKRTAPWSVLTPGVVAIALGAVYVIEPSTTFPISATLISLAGVAACYKSRCRDLGQALSVTAICLLPFVLFAFCNLVICCVFMITNGAGAITMGMLSTVFLGSGVNLIAAAIAVFFGRFITKARLAS